SATCWSTPTPSSTRHSCSPPWCCSSSSAWPCSCSSEASSVSSCPGSTEPAGEHPCPTVRPSLHPRPTDACRHGGPERQGDTHEKEDIDTRDRVGAAGRSVWRKRGRVHDHPPGDDPAGDRGPAG